MLKVTISHDDTYRPKDLRNLLKVFAKVRLEPKETRKVGKNTKITLGTIV